MPTESFASRHIGPRDHSVEKMLERIGANSLDELIDRTVPDSIRLKQPFDGQEAMSEYDYLAMLEEKAEKNKVFKSYIGLGYHPTVVPTVIQRNVLENPGWYTAYTPYQAEIAQGRLEGLLNFQTMVSDLTGLELANASLLDEATAGAEAMMMFYNTRSRKQVKAGAVKFFVSEECFPQTLSVMEMRAQYLDIELIIGDYSQVEFTEEYFGAMVQYPAGDGEVRDYKDFTAQAHEVGAKVAIAADILSLAILVPPGEWGADVVFGNTQRFGVPMGFGGPHAAYFAAREEFKRSLPGRIIGVSKDIHGKSAYRMALQTREQHIRRDKATSNICTAQALLAVMAGMYAVYHGAEGIRRIAQQVHNQTRSLAQAVEDIGYTNINKVYFDTLKIDVGDDFENIQESAESNRLNFRYFDDERHIGISLNETTNHDDLIQIVSVLAEGKDFPKIERVAYEYNDDVLDGFMRNSKFLEHPNFNTHRSETEMMRYLKKLENRDISLTHSMIPLGSCTMKLNAASELLPITWPEFASVHPFAPKYQVRGYKEIIEELEKELCEITGFAGVSLQPNSGAQGEYTGLLVIRAYHESRGESHRNICLIPESAHGTNPASAVMAGMKVVVVKCDDRGNTDIDDLREKAEKHSDNLAAFMITYPSTHGVFEQNILEFNQIIHDNGGQVYMDGANMNAQVGLTNPGTIGADVCHLNLHKTFAIPHGGGGPGMGPIGVAEHLIPFLPGNPLVPIGGEKAIHSVSAAPFGSALILLISYGYIKMLGVEGLTRSTKMAILNANYIRARLKDHYPVLYTGKNGTVAHEMIVDCRGFKQFGIEVEDIAKRLIDYGFHAPTVSFPVNGTMMIEPTESESLSEMDRFCDAMISIREEIREVEMEIADKKDNVLKNSPHTAVEISSDHWTHSYGREKAAYPLSYIREAKFWPSVGRIDSAYGDRNLMCTCPPLEDYKEELV
ncbi:aminomethyl-transferring glycine dehydrogenase [Halocola ammonii]